MGFVVVRPETVDLDVDVKVPGAGKSQTFQIKIKYLSMRERDAFVRRCANNDDDDADTILSIVKGWKHVRDEGGDDITFSEQAFKDLIDIPYVYSAVVSALLAELTTAIHNPAMIASSLAKN